MWSAIPTEPGSSTQPLPAPAAGPRRVTLSLISAERAWKTRQSPGRQGPRSTGIFLGWQLALTHQLSQFRSRELLHSSPTSTPPCPPSSSPADSSSPVGTEQLWGGGGRSRHFWGQDGAVPVPLGTAAPLVAGWAGEGRLSCSGSGSSEQGWLVHMSLGSVVYFFKAGVCFLISKALLCSFPNKA